MERPPQTKRSSLKLLLPSALLIAAACGGRQVPPQTHQTTAAPRQRPEVVLVVERSLLQPASAAGREVGARALAPPSRPRPVGERLAELLEIATEQFRDYEFQEALRTLAEGQALAEAEATSPTDFERLHQILLLRMVCELVLDRRDQAAMLARAAAALGDLSPTDERHLPPDPRALYLEARAIIDAEPRAPLRVTSDPADAQVLLDGEYLGQTPLTHEASSGSHHLLIESYGYEPHRQTVDLAPSGTVVEAALELASEDTALTQVMSSSLESLSSSSRAALREVLGATLLIRIEQREFGVFTTAVELDSGQVQREEVAFEEQEPSRALITLLQGFVQEPEQAEQLEQAEAETSRGQRILRSPWLWSGVGLALAAAVASIVTVSVYEPPPRVVLTPNP